MAARPMPASRGLFEWASRASSRALLPVYLPSHQNRWILSDSYPDKERRQHLYLLHVPEHRLVPLGRFLSPREYTGEWRCDTHPRPCPDGTSAIFDSPHGSNGRQMYRIDLADVVKG